MKCNADLESPLSTKAPAPAGVGRSSVCLTSYPGTASSKTWSSPLGPMALTLEGPLRAPLLQWTMKLFSAGPTAPIVKRHAVRDALYSVMSISLRVDGISLQLPIFNQVIHLWLIVNINVIRFSFLLSTDTINYVFQIWIKKLSIAWNQVIHYIPGYFALPYSIHKLIIGITNNRFNWL